MANNKPNIILFDIETSPIEGTFWGLYDQALSHKNITKDWYIFCAAWKSLGDSKLHTVQIKKTGDDYDVVRRLRDELSKADVLVGHNLDKFDIRKLNARLIYHKLPPLPQIPTVDTKKEAKKVAAFTSNRLDYLAKLLTGKGKIHVEYDLWLDVMVGKPGALETMVKYNKYDIVCLERVYKWLLPYMKNHPHVGVMKGKDRKESCPKCGGSNMKRNGIRVTAAGMKKQELQCQGCGSYHRIPIK